MRLNVEEMYFLAMLNTDSRESAFQDIIRQMDSFPDPETEELALQVLLKLDRMSDQDFAESDFAIYREDEDDE